MKAPRSRSKRVSRYLVATLLVALVGVVWFQVAKDAAKEPDLVARDYGVQNYYVGRDGFRHDKVELTPEFKEAAKDLRTEITEATNKSGLNMGRVHFADRLLKDLLRKRYSIEWRTLGEMNPEVMID